MRVTQISISNFRSIGGTTVLQLGGMNVLIGANNAGKSSVLRALYTMQGGLEYQADIRDGSETWDIQMRFDDISRLPVWRGRGSHGMTLTLSQRTGQGISRRFVDANGGTSGAPQIPPLDPDHFVVPFLSRRKVAVMGENMNDQFARAVAPSMEHLAAKLFRLSSPDFPGHDAYRAASMSVLGFVVSALPSPNGARPGVYLPNGGKIWLDQMGEGVPNAVALMADLAGADGKLFLIEEPENDLHPAALKGLLELVLQSAARNQFVVSTHSNIVLRHLASKPDARIFKVEADRTQWPISASIRELPPTTESRLEVLKELGYTLEDFELWDGWLILEEASAERVIRDYLIPWFAPRLSRVRTLSAGGVDGVEPAFQDFNRVVRYAHLEAVYQRSSWVLVDGDESGRRVVDRLRASFTAWPEDRFRTFSEQSFEAYYPRAFAERVNAALQTADRAARREAKRDLLLAVLSWLDSDHERAKNALLESAIEVIEVLRAIEATLG